MTIPGAYVLLPGNETWWQYWARVCQEIGPGVRSWVLAQEAWIFYPMSAHNHVYEVPL